MRRYCINKAIPGYMKKEQLENKEDLGKSNKIHNKTSIEKLETNRKFSEMPKRDRRYKRCNNI